MKGIYLKYDLHISTKTAHLVPYFVTLPSLPGFDAVGSDLLFWNFTDRES